MYGFEQHQNMLFARQLVQPRIFPFISDQQHIFFDDVGTATCLLVAPQLASTPLPNPSPRRRRRRRRRFLARCATWRWGRRATPWPWASPAASPTTSTAPGAASAPPTSASGRRRRRLFLLLPGGRAAAAVGRRAASLLEGAGGELLDVAHQGEGAEADQKEEEEDVHVLHQVLVQFAALRHLREHE